MNAVIIRYANNSNYKNDTMIRKEAYVHSAVMDELRRIIEDSEIMAEVCCKDFVNLKMYERYVLSRNNF